jgi:hypothetical protein
VFEMNWLDFLADNHIPYVTAGPNTKRGEVSIKCPWCGEDDPSEHLGIQLEGRAWGCHRNPAHRGKSKTYLIQGILGVSKAQAKLVLRQYDASDPETLDQVLLALGEQPQPQPPRNTLVMPPDFRLLKDKGSSIKACNYLYKRGFDDPVRLGRTYDLRYCSTGRWKDRIIVPVYQSGRLVAWTGRALTNPTHAPRYLTTSSAIKSAIFNEDTIYLGGRILFITEGPIDAMKMDYYSPDYVRATCVFGTSITVDQIYILRRASERYRRVILLLDPDAFGVALNTLEWLPGAKMGCLPPGVDDPGALDKQEVPQVVNLYDKRM